MLMEFLKTQISTSVLLFFLSIQCLLRWDMGFYGDMKGQNLEVLSIWGWSGTEQRP